MKNLVPIVVQQGTKQYYWVKNIFYGIQQSAGKSNYLVKIVEDASLLNKAEFQENNCVIVVGYTTNWLYSTLNSLASQGFNPIVANPCFTYSIKQRCNIVSFQLEHSVERIIKYLLSAKKKHIALLGINDISLADQIKEKVFRNILGEESENLIFRGKNPLFECVDEFIDYFSKGNIDAVICSNDTVAIYLINRMLNDGFNLPKSLYVVGMGNSELSQRISIPITTIEFDYKELGVRALDMWRDIQKKDINVHNEILIPCKFIVRESTENIAENHNSIINDRFLEKETNVEIDEKNFYDDVDVKRIIKFEDLLISSDKIDIGILDGILNGNSDSKMAGILNISDRAIRYRINKMFKRLCIQTREEMIEIIRELYVTDLGKYR